MDSSLLALLEEAQIEVAKILAGKAKDGTISAAEMTRLRELYKDAGGSLTYRDEPTEATGRRVLECLDDVDPALLKGLQH